MVLDEIILQYSVGVFHPLTAKFYYDWQDKSRSFWGMSESRDKCPLMSQREVVASQIRADIRSSQQLEFGEAWQWIFFAQRNTVPLTYIRDRVSFILF